MTSKFILLMLLIAILSIFDGCNKKNKESDKSLNSPTPSPVASEEYTEPENKTDDSGKTQSPDIEDNNNNIDISVNYGNVDNNSNNQAVSPKLEDFSELDKYIKDYTFDVLYENSQDYEVTYSVSGEYDLDGNGSTDKINALLKSGYEDGSYIEVNGQKLDLYPESPTGEMYIIDLDSRDNYQEIAVYDDGPSGDPQFSFYRYDGNILTYVGNIDRYALADGLGKFISWFHIANRFSPKFYSAWGEFKDGEYVITNQDVRQYIGQSFEFEGYAYFVPMDEFPENYIEHTIWDPEAMKEFETTKIKLLDIYIDEDGPILNWFYVEMPDGQKGLLYFWIGD